MNQIKDLDIVAEEKRKIYYKQEEEQRNMAYLETEK